MNKWDNTRKKIEEIIENGFSDFMLSENLVCGVVCAETNSVFAEEIWSERRKSCQNFVDTGVSSQKIHEVGIT